MIAVDTNVLVRHLYQRDDPAQTREANRVIGEAIAAGETVYISVRVLAETIWVLRGVYGLAKAGLVRVIETLWKEPSFTLQEGAAVRTALDQFIRGGGDFSDYLIGQLARDSGSRTTYTFDGKLRRGDGFTWLRGL